MVSTPGGLGTRLFEFQSLDYEDFDKKANEIAWSFVFHYNNSLTHSEWGESPASVSESQRMGHMKQNGIGRQFSH